MGNSNYFDEWIVSYLSGELNADDEAFVLEWINSSKENKQHFEELRSTWNLLAAEKTVKDIDVDAEWNRFRQSVSAEPADLSMLQLEAAADNQYAEDAIAGKNLPLPRLFRTIAVAAS